MAKAVAVDERPPSLEEVNDLRHFLKVARPEWSKPRQGGPNDIDRVIAKLRTIGISDTETLVHRVHKNTLNDDLARKKHVRLSREAIESIRRHCPFIRTLEAVDVPHIRQTGMYAPVPQLLSRKRLVDPGLMMTTPRNGGKTKSASSSATQLPKSSNPNGFVGMASTHAEGFGVWDHANAKDMPFDENAGTLREHVRLRGAALRRRPHASRAERERPSYADVSMSKHQGRALNSHSYAARSMPDTSSLPQLDNGAQRLGAALSNVEQQADSQTTAQNDGRRHSLKSVVKAQILLQRLQRHPDGSLPALPCTEVSPNEVVRLQRVGAAMGASKREARWIHTRSKPATALGEEMLSEQESFDATRRLLRQAHGDDPSLKMHITGNIACRLKQELKTQGQEALSMQQKCLNIKKHLADMTAFRRELTGLKSQVEQISGEGHKNDEALKELGKGFARVKRDINGGSAQVEPEVSTNPVAVEVFITEHKEVFKL
jgi:hypothetical protein